MAWGRFGFGPADDDQPIEFWMDDQNDQAAQREAFDAAGRQHWDASTRSGQNLDASRPVDLVALGASATPAAGADDSAAATETSSASRPAASSGDQPEAASTSPTRPSVRYVKARPGDTITALAGSSEPSAVGAFARLNGMNGGSSTIYAGRVYAIPATDSVASPDDASLGGRLLQHDSARVAATRAQRATNDQFQTRFDANQNVWTGEPVVARPSLASTPQSTPFGADWADRVNRGGLMKMIARNAAIQIGEPIGALRGVVNIGRDAIDTLGFVGRLANPLDPLLSPPGRSARQQTAAAAGQMVQFGQQVSKNPQIALDGLKNFAQRSAEALIPEATPEAATVAGEFARVLPIALNRGELQANVGGIVLGDQAVEAARAARVAATAVDATRFLERYPEATEYWNAPSRGRGSHFISQNKGKFSYIGGVPVPDWLSRIDVPPSLREAQIFRLGPQGFTNAEMQTRHALVDPQLYGGRISPEYGRGWSARNLGLDRRLPPVGRVWYGASPQLKGAVVAGLVGGSVSDDYLREWGLR